MGTGPLPQTTNKPRPSVQMVLRPDLPAQDYLNDSYSWRSSTGGAGMSARTSTTPRCFCGDGTAIARSQSGGLVDVYLGFFYTKDVPGRAETLIHEARHKGGKPHNAKFPLGSTFGSGKSGADSTWDYEGAWMYGALYLWWYYAQGAGTTSALRERARQRGNVVIDNVFATYSRVFSI